MKKTLNLFIIFLLCYTINAQIVTNLPEMIFVKGKTFEMGNNDGEKNEKPAHKVKLSSFYIGKYEITNLQFAEFLFSYGQSKTKSTSDFPDKTIITKSDWGFSSVNPEGFENPQDLITTGYENFPVTNVTWFGAYEYCKWLSDKTGEIYSLPTEAQWEFAAGSGKEHQLWAGTNSDTDLGTFAWFTMNSSSMLHQTGTKKPNSFDIYDMSGNTWEWCEDWYCDTIFTAEKVKNPVNTTEAKFRVLRGGSWACDAKLCRSSFRYFYSPQGLDADIGFRVVKQKTKIN